MYVCMGVSQIQLGCFAGITRLGFWSARFNKYYLGTLSLSIHILSAKFDLLIIGEKSCMRSSQPNQSSSGSVFMTVLLSGMPLAYLLFAI